MFVKTLSTLCTLIGLLVTVPKLTSATIKLAYADQILLFWSLEVPSINPFVFLYPLIVSIQSMPVQTPFIGSISACEVYETIVGMKGAVENGVNRVNYHTEPSPVLGYLLLHNEALMHDQTRPLSQA